MASVIVDLLMPPGAAVGTGTTKLPHLTKKLLNLKSIDDIPENLVELAKAISFATFGGYPADDSNTKAACGVLIAANSILCLAHLYIFIRNVRRNHNFYLTIGYAATCLLNVLGYGLRIYWGNHFVHIPIGLASTILIIISAILLTTLNTILAHRIFTWKHPEAGNSRWFNTAMIAIYSVVIGIIVLAIVSNAVPNTTFLSPKHFNMCKKAFRAAAILQCIYSAAALVLIVLSYILPPGSVSQHSPFKKCGEAMPHTYSPYWIESYALNYFVPKSSVQPVYRNDNLAQAIRIINSSEVPGSGRAHFTHPSPKDGIEQTLSVVLVTFTSILLLISSCFRCASTFIDDQVGGGASQIKEASWIFDPTVMYVLYGGLQVIVNVLFVFGRFDLRFYLPDNFINKDRDVEDHQQTSEKNDSISHDIGSAPNSTN